MLNISKSIVHKWSTQLKDNILRGHSRITKIRKSKKNSTPIQMFLCSSIQNNPFLTLMDLRKAVFIQFGFNISITTVSKILKLNKIHRKRVRRVVVKSQAYLDTLQLKREQFVRDIRQINENKIVSVDETAFYKQMVPTYGYCKSGERLLAQKTSQRHEKYTILSAVTNKTVVAYQIIKGSATKAIYMDFVKNKIIPVLNGGEFYLLADNLQCHHSTEVKELVTLNNGHCIYTPPYSPDFNPIENVFSVVKHYVKKQCLHNVRLLKEYIEYAFDSFNVSLLQNMFTHSFYGTHSSHDKILLDRIAFKK